MEDISSWHGMDISKNNQNIEKKIISNFILYIA